MTLNILWQSNAAHAATGYGNQTALIVPALRTLGHNVAEFAFYGLEGGMLSHDGIRVYPKGLAQWGDDIGAAHAKHFGADLVVLFQDSWVLNLDNYRDVRTVLYAPVDHEPLPNAIAAKLRQCWHPVMYSEFGQAMAAQSGIETSYVPHCVDTTLFYPERQQDARTALGWPQDRPILVTVAANRGYPSRKNLPQMIRAFAEVKKQHPTALWYIHTNMGSHAEYGGVNLPALLQQAGVKDAVLFPDQYRMHLGFPADYMRAVYNAGDLFYLPSAGEGFGIPFVEALACGTPILAGNWTAMEDFRAAPGWFLDKDSTEAWDTPLNAAQFIPHHQDLCELLDLALEQLACAKHDNTTDTLFTLPAQMFAARYDVQTVAHQYWKPLLETLEARIRHEQHSTFPGFKAVDDLTAAANAIVAPADRYAFYLNHWSDIQTHLPLFYDEGFGNVVELGTRNGVSTSALLAGVEEHGGFVVSVDSDTHCETLFDHEQWLFVHGSSTDEAICERVKSAIGSDGIQTLLIDTEHTAAQVAAELSLWGALVQHHGHILLHDTDSFPEIRTAIETWVGANNVRLRYESGSNGLGVITIM